MSSKTCEVGWGSPSPSSRHSARRLAEIARHWGYGCEVRSDAAADPRTADSRVLVEGPLATTELAGGVKLCASDLVAVADNERIGVLRRSLTVIVMLGGDRSDYGLGPGKTLSLAPNEAAVVASLEGARLTGRYRCGRRYRSLVLQMSPETLEDDELAGQLDRLLRANCLRPLALSGRLQALANELFSPASSGTVGRLLAESCALEILARALSPSDRPAPRAAGQLPPRDLAKMLRVRDKLVAEVGGDHRLCDLARLAGVSVSTLKSKFPAAVGQTVFEFLRDQRMERARLGLEREGWSVKQAAYFVGYSYPANFSAAYRRRFGLPPSSALRA